jgi:hypothetical protein
MDGVSRYHLQQISSLGGTSEQVISDNQDRILAELVVRQVELLRSQRSAYVPVPLPHAPVFFVV